MLPMIRKVVWNELDKPKNEKLLDLSRLELAIIVPMVIMIVLMGVYPKPFIGSI
jgi:NADH-quinone oxidoreductase subunit M